MFVQTKWFEIFPYGSLFIVAFVVVGACDTQTYPAPVRECSTTADCAESTSPCATSKCVAGRCLEIAAAAGTVVEVGVEGDCHRSECDDAGNVVSVIDDLDKPADTDCMFGTCASGTPVFDAKPAGFVVTMEPIGDCQQIECDGSGKGTTVTQDLDIPVDVGVCFIASCIAGMPTQTPKEQGEIVDDPSIGDCQRIVCDGMGNEISVAHDADLPDDTNVCTDDGCVQGVPTYVPVAAGTLVDNGIPGDCLSAQCDGMGSMIIAPNDSDVPSDAAVCTVDSCNAGAPVHTPKPTGTSCGSNNAICHPDGRCDSCADPGANCPDNGYGEPNDSQATATNFGTISDNDSAGKSFCAVLSGTSDVDWFTYRGSDDLFSEVDPVQSISNGTKGQLCAFFKCDAGATNLTCLGGSAPATAPGGQSGCCAESSFPVNLECGSVDDDAQVWLRVDNPDANACIPYRLEFHY